MTTNGCSTVGNGVTSVPRTGASEDILGEQCPWSPYLQHVSTDVILEGPVQGMEDLEDLILLQHTEESVQ